MTPLLPTRACCTRQLKLNTPQQSPLKSAPIFGAHIDEHGARRKAPRHKPKQFVPYMGDRYSVQFGPAGVF